MIVHALFVAASAVIAAGTGWLLVTAPGRWLADDAHTRAVTSSRAFTPWVLVIVGVVIAAVAAALLPAGAAVSGDSAPVGNPAVPESTAMIGSDAPSAPTGPGWVDFGLLALCLGAAAGATPVLLVTDLLVRRLPDRIMYPLIGVLAAAIAAGIAFGTSIVWWFGLLGAVLGLALFGGLHLIGRLLRQATMGLGDVKLAVVVAGISGLFSPWAPALVLVLTMVIAGVWSLVAGLRTGRVRGTTIAFGPAMLSGLWLGSVSAPFVL